MIVSASRRTDIPAFYARWFINRVREGFCFVVNPFNSKQVSRVSLHVEDVDAVVFWTRNPKPILEHLPELDQRGFAYYFQVTLLDYPEYYEPYLPRLDRRIESFKRLSERIGPDRVIWRYDPIIVSTATPFDWHGQRFEYLAGELEGFTHRSVVSFVDFYRKTERRLSELEKTANVRFEREPLGQPEAEALLTRMSGAASTRGLEIRSCAEPADLSHTGVSPGACIDGELIRRLGGPARLPKDPGQRPACRCVVSRDVGVNDTCIYGCRYCYATGGDELPRRRYARHDPRSPFLYRQPGAGENAVPSAAD